MEQGRRLAKAGPAYFPLKQSYRPSMQTITLCTRLPEILGWSFRWGLIANPLILGRSRRGSGDDTARQSAVEF